MRTIATQWSCAYAKTEDAPFPPGLSPVAPQPPLANFNSSLFSRVASARASLSATASRSTYTQWSDPNGSNPSPFVWWINLFSHLSVLAQNAPLERRDSNVKADPLEAGHLPRRVACRTLLSCLRALRRPAGVETKIETACAFESHRSVIVDSREWVVGFSSTVRLVSGKKVDPLFFIDIYQRFLGGDLKNYLERPRRVTSHGVSALTLPTLWITMRCCLGVRPSGSVGARRPQTMGGRPR